MLTCRNQKDRTSSYLTLLSTLLTPASPTTPPSATPLIEFGTHFTTSTSTAVVVGRRVLSIYVLALCAGSGLEEKVVAPIVAAAGLEEGELGEWIKRGTAAFGGGQGGEEGGKEEEEGKQERRGEVVAGVLEKGASGWCEEQVSEIVFRRGMLLRQARWQAS